MNKLAQKDHIIQVGHLDEEIQEIINLIRSYELPSDLFQWLTDGNYTKNILQENTLHNKHTRIVQYGVDSIPLFTGRVELWFDHLSQEAIKFIVNDKRPLGNDNSKFLNFQVKRFSQTTTELHYTVVSKIYKQDTVIGSGWEIYELPELIKLYSKMEDPLRYWRSNYS